MGKEDVVHIYNGILLSHKKNEIIPFATSWMDLKIIILSEVYQTKKYKYMILLTLGSEPTLAAPSPHGIPADNIKQDKQSKN